MDTLKLADQHSGTTTKTLSIFGQIYIETTDFQLSRFANLLLPRHPKLISEWCRHSA